MSMEIRAARSSVKGLRPRNEDAVLEVTLRDGRQLVAVADGMGGHRSGEVASAMAVQVLAEQLQAGRSLVEAVQAANRAIFQRASDDPTCAGMGTTLVAYLRTGPVYQIANVGDSRAYRVDASGIRQLTFDHSFLAEATRAGRMTPEEIARSPWRNSLTRSLGTGAEVEVDLFGPYEIAGAPHALLLCTDGLHRYLEDRLWRHLMAAGSVHSAVENLTSLALESGSDDNVTVAVVEFGALRASRRVESAAPARVMPPPAPMAMEAARPLVAVARHPGRRSVRTGILSDDTLFLIALGLLVLWLLRTLTG